MSDPSVVTAVVAETTRDKLADVIRILMTRRPVESEEVAQWIYELAEDSKTREALVSAGVVDAMAGMIQSRDDCLIGAALKALTRLTKANLYEFNRTAIRDGLVVPLIKILSSDTAEKHLEWGAWVLANLACDDGCDAEIANAGGIPPLVKLLRCDSDDVKAEAIRAINFIIWECDKYHDHVKQAGGLPSIVELLSGPERCRMWAVFATMRLARSPACSRWFLSANTVELLIERLFDDDEDCKDEAAKALKYISLQGDEAGRIVVSSRAIPRMLEYQATWEKVDDSSYGTILRTLEIIAENYTPQGELSLFGSYVQTGTARQRKVVLSALGLLAFYERSTIKYAALNVLASVIDCVWKTDEENRTAAIEILLTLCKSSSIHSEMIDAGIVPTLVHVVFSGSDGDSCSALQTLSALIQKAPDQRRAVEELRLSCGVDAIVELAVADRDNESRQYATGLLVSLAQTINHPSGSAPGNFVGLDRFDTSQNEQVVVALWNMLSTNKSSPTTAMTQHLVSELCRLLQAESEPVSIREYAVRVLGCLLR